MIIVKSGQSMPKSIAIPTPSFGINNLLGGGLWTGRIHYFWGPRQVGKSTLVLQMLAQAQKMGFKAIIVDTEKTMTDEWLDRCGIDRVTPDMYICYKSTNLDEILEALMPEIKKGKCAIMVDSMNNLSNAAFFEKAIGNNAMAQGAKARGKFLQRVGEVLHPEHNILFCISQQTTHIGSTHTWLKAKMSEKEDHDATNIIRLEASKKDYVTENDGTISHKTVKWTINKSKQAAVEGAASTYNIDLATSMVDRNFEISTLAVNNGVIVKGGAWYTWGDKKFHGLPALVKSLDQESFDRLESELVGLKNNLVIDDGTGEIIENEFQQN